MNETQEVAEKKYDLALVCEACGQPLKLISVNKDGDGWLAECSDARCRTLHQGSF